MSHLLPLLAASLACDLLLAWLFLRRGPLTLPRLLRAGAWGLVGALVQGALVQALLGRAFLAIHFVHTWLFVAAPLACAAALLAARRGGGSRPGRATAASAVLLLPALLAWTSLVEPFQLRLERVDVPLGAARAPQPPLRIGVLSDLQCTEVGAHEREAVATLMAQKPDLIVLPGDVEQVFSPEALAALEPSLRALLAELDAPLGVFLVLGNCDPGEGTQRLIAGTRVRLLVDETVHLQHAGRGLALCGLTLAIGAPPAQAALDELEAGPESELRLVLAHYPDAALRLAPGTRVDLVIAGHTHGGQVRLPWFGPLVTLSHVPREVAGGGLHALNGTQIYVSRGVGVERGDAPRIRFNCPPEVSLLTLGATLPAP
ncbi:MAG TPA: metallophosphoesterase [Planctomycetota bacterium]|nr:metallophosphoesterase [Planctomycetota bacterium]